MKLYYYLFKTPYKRVCRRGGRGTVVTVYFTCNQTLLLQNVNRVCMAFEKPFLSLNVTTIMERFAEYVNTFNIHV